jgi:TonB-linked SusC/RagA family outer membrane protein
MKKKLLITITLIVVLLGGVYAQQLEISGTVTSASDGLPLPGATVLAEGNQNIGTVTNAEGNYSLKVPQGVKSISFSFIGMETKTVNIEASGVFNVALESSTEALGEVVVTALGIERQKKALGYSVQEIAGSSLAEAREANVANSLKGKVAGVFVNSSSGGAGGSSFVLIRGSSSLKGDNQPLYVVDGIPINNDNLGQADLAGRDYGDGIKDINPDDIESMSVLKGPSAAALYGSRGANGVILITTKKSLRKKGLGVTLNSNFTVEKINVIPTFQNKYGLGYDDNDLSFGKITVDGEIYSRQETWMLDNWGPAFDDRPIWVPGLSEEIGAVPFTAQPNDNLSKFYETGTTFTNTVSLDGGSEKINYRVSLSNMDIKGVIPNNTFNRSTINISLGADVTERLRIETKANYINQLGENTPYIGLSSAQNVAAALQNIPRHISLDYLKDHRKPNGSYRNWRNNNNPTNPYWIVNEMTNESRRERLIGYVLAKYKLATWLNIQGRAGSDSYTETRNEQYSMGTPISDFRNGYVNTDQYRVNELNTDVLLTASGNLSEKFTGLISVGANRYTRRYERLGLYGTALDIPEFYTIKNSLNVVPTNTLIRKEIQSVYTTGQLAYNNYLFLDLTARNDWSSTLGKDNYSFLYPSASLSYVVTDALKINSRTLNFLKLRASYAQAGNDASPYQTMPGYTIYTTNFKGQRFAGINSTVPPLALKNELTSSYEFGTDFRLFDNRIAVDFTYYNSKTSNQILNVGVSNATGYDGMLINAGEISNKGGELFVTLVPLRNKNSLNWKIDLNFAKNISEVVELTEGIESLTLISQSNGRIEARPGQPYGNIVGYEYKRNEAGERVVHSSGNYYVRSDDRVILGNIQPDWLAGVTNTFSFKGFELSGLIDIRYGGEIFSNSKYDQMAKGTGVFTENRENLVIDGVIANGDGTYTQSTKTGVWGQHYYAQLAWGNIGEEFVLDASYVSLREATFGYSFNPAILNNTPFKSAKLSAVGRNLLYIYRDPQFKAMGITPEAAFAPTSAAQGYEAFSMPSTRSVGFNLSLTF